MRCLFWSLAAASLVSLRFPVEMPVALITKLSLKSKCGLTLCVCVWVRERERERPRVSMFVFVCVKEKERESRTKKRLLFLGQRCLCLMHDYLSFSRQRSLLCLSHAEDAFLSANG